VDGSFFDLGLTSLRLTEVKQRLETMLGCGINANVLFNRPTVSQLMEHLTGDVLAELFVTVEQARAADANAAVGGASAQWNDVLDDLYRT